MEPTNIIQEKQSDPFVCIWVSSAEKHVTTYGPSIGKYMFVHTYGDWRSGYDPYSFKNVQTQKEKLSSWMSPDQAIIDMYTSFLKWNVVKKYCTKRH